MRQQLEADAKQLWQQIQASQRRKKTVQGSNNSIYVRTSFMHLRTMRKQSDSSVLLTTTIRKWYVLLDSLVIHSKTELTDQGELEHRRVKRFYPRTSKVGFVQQIAKHQRRERVLHNLSKTTTSENVTTAAVSFQESDPLPYTPPTAHHHISNSNRYHDNLTGWLGTHSGDPALTVC